MGIKTQMHLGLYVLILASYKLFLQIFVSGHFHHIALVPSMFSMNTQQTLRINILTKGSLQQQQKVIVLNKA